MDYRELQCVLIAERSNASLIFSATAMPWPPDAEHNYELCLENAGTSGLHRAYVTAHPKDNRGGARSRFAVRLDLPGKYSTKAQAEDAAFHIANRFFRRKVDVPEREVTATVKGYVTTARARFRKNYHPFQCTIDVIPRCPRNFA